MKSTILHQDYQVSIEPSCEDGHLLLSVFDKITSTRVIIQLDYAQAGMMAFGLENAMPSEVGG